MKVWNLEHFSCLRIEFFPRKVSVISQSLQTSVFLQWPLVFSACMSHNHVILCCLDYIFWEFRESNCLACFFPMLLPKYTQSVCQKSNYIWEEYSDIRKILIYLSNQLHVRIPLLHLCKSIIAVKLLFGTQYNVMPLVIESQYGFKTLICLNFFHRIPQKA